MLPSTLHIALVVKPGHPDSGVGRYAFQLESAMRLAGHQVDIVQPVLPLPSVILRLAKNLFGWDLAAFFYTYPLWARYPEACDIYHFTSQNQATLLLFCPPPGPVVITVHDIIPFISRRDPEQRVYASRLHQWMDTLAMRGLKKARWLVADSDATRRDLVEKLGLNPASIQVVPLGILADVQHQQVLAEE
jgi:hypothetical protein